MIHISYETAKKLKEFLGESSPEPMGKRYYWKPYIGFKIFGPHNYNESDSDREQICPAYQLHDLLSKPFCEAMAKAINTKHPCPKLESYPNEEPFKCHAERPRHLIHEAYWAGGLPAVEKALCEMMEVE